MALRLELKRYLDNTEEPLAKKVKLADNVYKHDDFPINGREIFLINWFCKNLDSKNLEQWQQLDEWIASGHFKNLNQNELSFNDFELITNFIKEKSETSKNEEISKVIINIAINLIENQVFHKFFKLNFRGYCMFISTIIKHTESLELVLKIVKSDFFLSKNFWICDDYQETVLEILVFNLVDKFTTNDENSKLIFAEISKLLQKSFFLRNEKIFERYFESYFQTDIPEEKLLLPILIFKFLKKSYLKDENLAQNSYKLIFHAFCSTYNRDFNTVFKFFAFLNLQIGFDCTQDFNLTRQFTLFPKERYLEKSLKILLSLLEVLSEIRNDFMSVLGKVKFSDFLQHTCCSVIKLKKIPQETSFKIFQQIILIHPLTIESIISEIIVYIVLPKHCEKSIHYDQLLISLTQVFMKLHRVENFLNKLMAALNSAYVGSFHSNLNHYDFLGKKVKNKAIDLELDVNRIFPDSFLNYLTQCIVSLQSGDVIILYKSLLKELNSSLEVEGRLVDSNKIVYIEVVCVLLSRFLASVRIAEHTVPHVSVKKFVKIMEEQKLCCSKFGNLLLSIEHNHALMRSFLNLCTVWADLYMILIHYSCNNELLAKKQEISESSQVNDLHTYLSKEQWCLISERITNFGEDDCKEILLKLQIQTFKSLTLFQPNLETEEVKQSLVKKIQGTLEEKFDVLFHDKYCEDVLLKEFDERYILGLSQSIVDKSLESSSNIYPTINKLLDNSPIMCSVLTEIMTRINALLKSKNVLLTNEIYNLLNEEEIKTKMIEEIFELKFENENKLKLKLTNQEQFLKLFNIMKHIPVTYLPDISQSKLYLFLWGLIVDLKSTDYGERNCIQCVEDIIFAMIQNGSFELASLLKPSISLKLLGYLECYESFYKKMLPKAIREEDDFRKLKKYVNLLSKDYNELNLKCTIITFKAIHRLKKNKNLNSKKSDLDNLASMICQNIYSYILSNGLCPVELFALILQHFLTQDNQENVNNLRPYLNNFINLDDKENDFRNNSCLSLFHTLLQFKTNFKDIINDEFLLKIWKFIKDIEVVDEGDIFSKILSLICYDISLENYQIMCKDILDNTIIGKNNRLLNVLNIWKYFIECDTVSNKKDILVKTLEELLFKLGSNDEIHENSNIITSICKFYEQLIQSQKIVPTAEILDLILIFISDILRSNNSFMTIFNQSMSILEALLSYRKVLICDRLPTYLLHYRTILEMLCKNSDSNEVKDLSINQAEQIFDSAYRFLKLTRFLCQLNKHIASLAMYLIADILQQYEIRTLFPHVKTQLNHCIYEFIAVSSHHSINCLMRILSPASTDSFKLLCDTYKKYYKFTGKV